LTIRKKVYDLNKQTNEEISYVNIL